MKTYNVLYKDSAKVTHWVGPNGKISPINAPMSYGDAHRAANAFMETCGPEIIGDLLGERADLAITVATL
jgi:hypothetical protein